MPRNCSPTAMLNDSSEGRPESESTIGKNHFPVKTTNLIKYAIPV
jgi:hypothetical protein